MRINGTWDPEHWAGIPTLARVSGGGQGVWRPSWGRLGRLLGLLGVWAAVWGVSWECLGPSLCVWGANIAQDGAKLAPKIIKMEFPSRFFLGTVFYIGFY